MRKGRGWRRRRRARRRIKIRRSLICRTSSGGECNRGIDYIVEVVGGDVGDSVDAGGVGGGGRGGVVSRISCRGAVTRELITVYNLQCAPVRTVSPSGTVSAAYNAVRMSEVSPTLHHQQCIAMYCNVSRCIAILSKVSLAVHHQQSRFQKCHMWTTLIAGDDSDGDDGDGDSDGDGDDSDDDSDGDGDGDAGR